MIRHHTVNSTFPLLSFVCRFLLAWIFLELQPCRATDDTYLRFPPIVDSEVRTSLWNKASQDTPLDSSAYLGLPREIQKAHREYVQVAIELLGTPELKRVRYYHKDRSGYDRPSKRTWDSFPDDVNPVRDAEVTVPLCLLPRPEMIEKWAASNSGQSAGWLTANQGFSIKRSVFGRTLIFKPHPLSVNPTTTPPSPLGTAINHWDAYFEDASFFSGWGKIVASPYYKYDGTGPLDDRVSALDLGSNLLCELLTVPAFVGNTRLRWVKVHSGSSRRSFLAYAMVDGNGARRSNSLTLPDGRSRYQRPLKCAEHQPRVNQHDELLLPTPLPWAPTFDDVRRLDIKLNGPHEEWCLDDWFPAQKDACWVIRATADSKPLQESFALMPASEKSELPLFFACLFAETEPEQLVKELSALHQISPDAALNSPEKMERLKSLYEKVRSFQFEQ